MRISKKHWHTIGMVSLLATVAAVTYTSSLRNSFVIWDDDSLVTENPIVQTVSPATIGKAFTSYDPELYVPLTMMSFQMNKLLGGFDPFIYHLTNLLLHIGCSVMVMFLLRRLGIRDQYAFLGALLFALHPINVEAVAWVSARKDVLSGAFSLLSLLFFLRSYERTGKDLLWSWIALLLALLSKPSAITLPLVMVALHWYGAHPIAKKEWKRFLPFFGLSAVFLVIALIGKTRNIGALTAWETGLLSLKSTAFSLVQYLWPFKLSVIYLQTEPITLRSPEFLGSLLILAMLGVGILWSLKKTRTVAFGALLYLTLLVPSFANFAKSGTVYFFSDRYVYLSQIGVIFLLTLGLQRLTKTISLLLMTPLLLLLAWTAHAQSRIWRDTETLYRSALEQNDRSAVMHFNLGLLEHKRGNREAALREYQRALELDPHYARALTNIGMWYEEAGERALAMDYEHRAIVANPAYAEPHNNLGSLLMQGGQTDEAIAEFRRAIALTEAFAQAHINLADALGKKGLYEEGLHHYRRAFDLQPELFDNLPEIRRALQQVSLP